jgi:hypothetical protein
MRPSGPRAVALNSADGPDAETELEMLVFQSRLCAERKRGDRNAAQENLFLNWTGLEGTREEKFLILKGTSGKI